MSCGENDQYLVHDILNYENRDGQQFFYVFWGSRYGKNSRSWEPLKNIPFLTTKKWHPYYLELKNRLGNAPVPKRRYSKARKFQGKSRRDIKSRQRKSYLKKSKKSQLEKEEEYVCEQIQKEKKQSSIKFPFEEVNKKKMKEKKAEQKMEMEVEFQEEEVRSSISEDQRQNLNDEMSTPLENKRDDSRKYKKGLMKTESSYLEKSNVKSLKSKKIFKMNTEEISYKVKQNGIQKQLIPCSIDLDIPKASPMPLAGLECEQILKPLVRQNNTLQYKVLLSKPARRRGRKYYKYIIEHNAVKLLWPTQLAEYLITRINTNNNFQVGT